MLDGRADFAISSFGEQRNAVAEDLPTVALMSAFQIPPLVIFSLAESGIASPADLAGKRVGVTTDYWKDVLDETLQAAGVKPSRVTAIPVEAGDLQPLYDGTVDAWLGYAQDEPIRAEVEGHRVRNVFPADYGVGGYEGLLLADRQTVEGAPELVRRFVQASQQGWRYAVEHPDEAARILLDWAPEPGLEFQRAGGARGRPPGGRAAGGDRVDRRRALAPADGRRLRSGEPGLHHPLLGLRTLTASRLDVHPALR